MHASVCLPPQSGTPGLNCSSRFWSCSVGWLVRCYWCCSCGSGDDVCRGIQAICADVTADWKCKTKKKGNKEEWEVYRGLVNEVGGKQRRRIFTEQWVKIVWSPTSLLPAAPCDSTAFCCYILSRPPFLGRWEDAMAQSGQKWRERKKFLEAKVIYKICQLEFKEVVRVGRPDSPYSKGF